MNIDLPPFVHQHIIAFIFAAWMLSNLAAAMPSPSPSSSGWYKTLFGFMHATFGSVPRIISTLWPQSAKYVTLGSTDGTPAPPVAPAPDAPKP